MDQTIFNYPGADHALEDPRKLFQKVVNHGAKNLTEQSTDLTEWLHNLTLNPLMPRLPFLSPASSPTKPPTEESPSLEPVAEDPLAPEGDAVSDAVSEKPCLEDYELLQVCGKGGFGKVFVVREKKTGAIRAMKVLSKAQIVKKKQVTNTMTERIVLEQVQNPFIIALHAAFQTPRQLFLVTDFIPGGELFYHLKQSVKFTEAQVVVYLAELLVALQSLHDKNIVYRDLKPENVMLDAEGHIKLVDMGLSLMEVTDEYACKEVCGSLEYLAPEIIAKKGYGRGADWWSLGCFTYELLTGLPPFHSRNKRDLLRRIRHGRVTYPSYLSAEARSLIQGLLQPRLTERLGCRGGRDAEDVMDHALFAKHRIDWSRVSAREALPPIIPSLPEGCSDTSNFSREFTSMSLSLPGEKAPECCFDSLEHATEDPFGGYSFCA